MSILKKILIALIIIIFVYILWRFIKRRNEILSQIENSKENFALPTLPTIIGTPTKENEFAGLKNSTAVTIQSATIKNLPLIEYCIKGSYNSALTGSWINTDMIKYLLSRGCRYFDLEIYYIQDPTTQVYTPQVGYSVDPKHTILSSENSVLLDNIFATIVSNSFASLTANGGSPNNLDPVFINLRIKSTSTDVYDAVASSIDHHLSAKLYKGKVTNKTILKSIMGHVIIIMDKTINPQYATITNCKQGDNGCYKLEDYINIESGSETLNMVTYLQQSTQLSVPINVLDNNQNTNVKHMKLANPELLPATKQNPVIRDYITKYNCQLTPNRFYYNDENLRQYEKFFNENSYALVPLAQAIQYYQKNPYII